MQQNPKLYLVPSPLAAIPAVVCLPQTTLQIMQHLQHWVVETEKTGRAILKEAGIVFRQNELSIGLLNEHTKSAEIEQLLTPIYNGFSLGVLSDAGCPAIADPGSALVRIAHQKGIEVVPLIGPSSITLALMASGMNGQNFCFHGYLPIEKNIRKKTIKQIEMQSEKLHQTQLFIETPYRNQALFQELINSCKPLTHIGVFQNLTAPNAFIRACSVQMWQKSPIEWAKIPTIFALSVY